MSKSAQKIDASKGGRCSRILGAVVHLVVLKCWCCKNAALGIDALVCADSLGQKLMKNMQM